MAESLQDERTRLRQMLAAREGKPGFTKNVEAIKARLVELDAEQSKKDG